MRSGVGIFASAHVVPSSGGAIYSDNFNRADGVLTAPWVSVEGSLVIASNKLSGPSGGPNISRYNQTFATDQFCEGDVAGFVEGGTSMGPAVRITGADLYYMWFSNIPSRVTIWKRVGGTYTQIASSVAAPPAAAFKARLEVQGTALRAYVNGELLASGSDASLTSGQPGVLGANGVGSTLDNWRAGPLPFVPLYSDDFNRADATTLSAPWFAPGWGIVSNQARRGSGTGGGDFATFGVTLGSPDHWSEMMLPAVNEGGGSFYVIDARRPSATDNDFNGTCYMVFVNPSGQVVIGKAIAGAYSDVAFGTNLGAWPGAVPIRIEVQGSTIRGYVNNVLHATATDTSITSGNWAGMNANGGSVDNFRCGVLPWTP